MEVVPSENEEIEELGQAWLGQNGFSDLRSPNSMVHQGNCPIHVACIEGNLEVVKWMVKKGVSLRSKAVGDLAFTPLICAVRSGHLELAKWIYETCVPSISFHDERDARGTTVMMYAVEKGHIEIASWMVSVGGSELLHDVNMKGSTVLIWSTHDQSMQAMKWLYERGCALETSNNEGNAAVMFACINGNLPMLQWLHSKGCPLNGSNIQQESLPILAADSGHLHILEYLLEASNHDLSYIAAPDASRRTVLHFAAMSGHLKVVEWVTRLLPELIDQENDTGFTPLMIATKHNQPETVRFLVSQSASLHTKSRRTLISLAMLAVVNCTVELCQWLKQCGVSFVERTISGTTAACFASQYGRLETLRWMISEMPHLLNDIGESDEDLAMYAARYGRLEVLKYLLEEDMPPYSMRISITRQNALSDTVASIAALEGHFGVLKWLADEHCPTLLHQKQGHIGTACILNASARGHMEIIEWLVLSKNVNPDTHNAGGISPSMWAAQMGHINVLEFLFANGGMLSSRHPWLSSEGISFSPALFAAVGGKISSLRWLEAHGAEFTTRDSSGNNILHWAAQGGHRDVIEWLLRRGFDIFELNYFGNDVVDAAELEGRTEVAQWLRQYMSH